MVSVIAMSGTGTASPVPLRLIVTVSSSGSFDGISKLSLYAPVAEASDLNFNHTGKRLSRQTINIMPKMQEVDTWLQQISPAICNGFSYWYPYQTPYSFFLPLTGSDSPMASIIKLLRRKRCADGFGSISHKCLQIAFSLLGQRIVGILITLQPIVQNRFSP